jgi:magnesium transporter
MLRYYVKRSRGEDFEERQSPTGDHIWVYGEEMTKVDVEYLATQYGLDQNILDDAFDAAELPRTEFSGDKEYIFLRSPQKTSRGRVTTHPILSVVGAKGYFVLSSLDGLPDVDLIKKGVVTGASQSTGLLLGTIAALLVMYDDLIDQTAHVIKDTGRRLKTHEVTNQDLIHFVVVEDNLNEYQMNLNGFLGVVRRLHENKRGFFTDQDLEALDDILLHVEQLLVGVDTYSKRVENIRNAYTTIANNNLNIRIKTLTVLTLLVALPNVFYGMFGMNVGLPFADEPWAYAAIVGFTIVIIFGVYVLARRLKIF